MNFQLDEAIAVLERTPSVVSSLLRGLPANWIISTEGPNTWSPYDIIGHLIYGEKTDWIPRTQIILERENKQFEPFNRFAQFEESRGKTIEDLLKEFEYLRTNNLNTLKHFSLTEADLSKTGIHPAFGTVTLAQLLATWVAHDLDHLAQLSRVMAKQYLEEVGPWKEYLRLLQS